MKKSMLVFAVFLAGFGPSANAQEVQGQAEPSCELHIWPAFTFTALNQGPGALFGGLSAMDDASANRGNNTVDQGTLKEALPPEKQVELIKQSNLFSAVNLSNYKLVIHDKNDLSANPIPSNYPNRSSGSKSKCYYEFFVNYGEFTSNFLNGSTLTNYFKVKYFSNGLDTPSLDEGTSKFSKVGIIRVSNSQDQNRKQAVFKQIHDAFLVNLNGFLEKRKKQFDSFRQKFPQKAST